MEAAEQWFDPPFLPQTALLLSFNDVGLNVWVTHHWSMAMLLGAHTAPFVPFIPLSPPCPALGLAVPPGC